jgi:stress-induced morphogen
MIKIIEIIEVPNMPKLYTQSVREFETLPYLILQGSEDNYHITICDTKFKGIQLTNNYDTVEDYAKVVDKLIFRIIYPIKKDRANIDDEYHMAGWLRFVIRSGRLLYETCEAKQVLKFLMFSRYILSHDYDFMNKKPFTNYETMITKKEGHTEDPFNNAKETHYKIHLSSDKFIQFCKSHKPNEFYLKKYHTDKYKDDINDIDGDINVQKLIYNILDNKKLRKIMFDSITNI